MRSDQHQGICLTKAIADISITRSFSVFPSATFIVLTLLVGAPAHAAADKLATCDRLTAHPDDKDKPSDIKGSYDIAKTDVAAALKACKAAVSASDAPRRAWFELGRAYEFKGQTAEAAKAYRKAVDAGNTGAMVGLGTLLVNGNGVKKNEIEARLLFEKAANAGDIMGMSNLAALYGAGLGVPVDFATARSWYEKAAERNHGGALERLGAYAREGRAGPKDEQAAIAFYKKAAALGSDDAANALQRLQCKFTLRDKDGKAVGSVCYMGE